jgi:hypothetical protein
MPTSLAPMPLAAGVCHVLRDDDIDGVRLYGEPARCPGGDLSVEVDRLVVIGFDDHPVVAKCKTFSCSTSLPLLSRLAMLT